MYSYMPKMKIGIILFGESFRIGQSGSREIGTDESVGGQFEAAASLYETFSDHEIVVNIATYDCPKYNLLEIFYPDANIMKYTMGNRHHVFSKACSDMLRIEKNKDIKYWFISRPDVIYLDSFKDILKIMVDNKDLFMMPWLMEIHTWFIAKGIYAHNDMFSWFPLEILWKYIDHCSKLDIGHYGDYSGFFRKVPYRFVLEREMYMDTTSIDPNPYYKLSMRSLLDKHANGFDGYQRDYLSGMLIIPGYKIIGNKRFVEEEGVSVEEKVSRRREYGGEGANI